jgi:NADP-reducing hydrogenase subunit HndB
MEGVNHDHLNVIVTQTGCMGSCTLEPMVDIYDKEGRKTTYIKMDAEKVAQVVESHLKNGRTLEMYTVNQR